MSYKSENLSSGIKLPLIFSLIISQLSGCATAPNHYTHPIIPDYIREIKTVRVYPDDKWKNTDIFIRQGELLSIMATGKILKANSSRILYPSSSSSLFLQVADSIPTLALLHKNARTFPSSWDGVLSFKIHGAQPTFRSTYFDVTVVVWRTKNYSLISDFFAELKKSYPSHPGIYEASLEATTLKDLQLEKETTFKKIEKTQNQIEEIQRMSAGEPDSTESLRAERLQILKYKLETLTAKLNELDNLAQKIQEQRHLSADLARKLQMLDQREKELSKRIGESAKAPPLLLITEPEENSRHETDTVRLAGAVEDDGGLSRLEILINGQHAESDKDRSLKTASTQPLRGYHFDRTLRLTHGSNRLQVRAIDTDGLVTEKTITVHYTPNRRNVWAVIVGINDYPKLPKLKFAANDAAEFQRLLVEKNRVPAENIHLLLNTEATLSNLRSIMGTRLRAAAAKDDMVIIYFAGHGSTERDALSPDGDGLEKYLLTWEADPKDLYATALPMREIAYIFDRIQSERLIFIVDACYSGASGGRTVGAGGLRATLSDSFLERLAAGRGKVIITASAANEVSVEKDELRHGVFTYYLLEGLRGAADLDRDGAVTVDEAYRYVSEKVPHATGQEQHPVKKGEVEGSIVLSITR